MSYYLHKTPGWIQRLFPSLVWSHPLPDTSKVIYLTFDDGPIPEVTPFVLDTLDRFQAQATFFCVGENIVKNPKVFEQVVSRGHAVGNHTNNHLKGWNTPNTRYFENIEKCEKEIVKYGGASKKLFRPPYGRITPSQIRLLRQEYKIIMWDILTGDYNASLSPDKVEQTLEKKATHGSIVVFHDSLKAERNLKFVLPKFLTHFAAEGFEFKSL